MGNLFCPDIAHLAPVGRDFCPFPDYSPNPLLNILSVKSSLLLSSHYTAVQASLTPQQQQDFTQSLRRTFGREGKVSYGGVGIVALSLAILFDTVSKEVKGEYVSDQGPIPGLFLKDPIGSYPPPVYTISRYLRLVPHIANNPTRMKVETEKYLNELRHAGTLAIDAIGSAQMFEDITAVNLMKCYVMGKNMMLHLERLSNKTFDEKDYLPKKKSGFNPEAVYYLNCDLRVASEQLLSAKDSFDDRTKMALKNCIKSNDPNAVENIANYDWFEALLNMDKTGPGDRIEMLEQTDVFDLKANALGRWN